MRACGAALARPRAAARPVRLPFANLDLGVQLQHLGALEQLDGVRILHGCEDEQKRALGRRIRSTGRSGHA